MQGPSLVVESGGTLCCGAWTSDVVASLIVEHRLQPLRLQRLRYLGSVVADAGLLSTGSVVVAHRLSCSCEARRIFPDQGSNPCPLHWQEILYPLHHQGSPEFLLNRSHRVCSRHAGVYLALGESKHPKSGCVPPQP